MEIFTPFGKVEDVRIIRKGSNGQILRESVYGFVELSSESEARNAMKMLNDKGWTINYGKKSHKTTSGRTNSTIGLPQALPMPSYTAFQHNFQATQIMLLNNANPHPGQPMENAAMLSMITKNHPNAFNVSGVLNQFSNSFLVREIWIGNISPSTEKSCVYEAFKMYGEIEGIEMFSSKGFAFTKYRKIVPATRAYELAQGSQVDGKPVKVAFADPTRRYDIVGDSNNPSDPGFDPMDDDNFKNLFLGYSAGTTIPSERVLREIFQRYGRIRSIYVKQATHSCASPYAFVDFDKGEQAAHARRALYIEDADGSRRAELGDPSLEISFKNTYSSNKPKHYPETREPESDELARKLLANSSEVLKFLAPVDPRIIYTPMAYPPMQYNTTPMGAYLAQTPMSYIPYQSAPLLPKPVQVSCMKQEPTPVVEESQVGKTVWWGFLTRSKLHRVGVDAVLLDGDSDRIPSTCHSLNITHRVPLTELGKLQTVGMFTLEASDDTQVGRFMEYIKYFEGKTRVGYFCLKNLTVYVVTPKFAREFFREIHDNQLLVVFQDPKSIKESPHKHVASISSLDPRIRRTLT